MNKTINKIIRKFIFHPFVFMTLGAIFFEWKMYHFVDIKEFFKDPLGSIIRLSLGYFVGYIAVKILQKVLTETEFITETNLKIKIENIIDQSKEFLYIISPYLDPGNVLIESIIKAKRNNIKVILIHNTNQIKKVQLSDDFSRLLSAGVEIYNHPRLHSKIYLNESESLVTSLNLISGSYTNSFESGIYCDYRSVRKSIEAYIHDTILKSDKCTMTNLNDLPPNEGYCIITGQKIPYNPERPIEYNEYKSHGKSVLGKYCHLCGQEVQTTVEVPFCANCQELKNS